MQETTYQQLGNHNKNGRSPRSKGRGHVAETAMVGGREKCDIRLVGVVLGYRLWGVFMVLQSPFVWLFL